MSEQNFTFILEDPIKEETDISLDNNPIQLGFIKDEVPNYQNNDDNNQIFDVDDSNLDIDVNTLEIKTESDYRNIVIQNSIIVKDEIDIKEEIITYLNNDDNNKTYHSENVSVGNNKSNDITNDTLNVCVEMETERNDKNPSFLHENLFIKIEQMSPEGSDVFKENIFEIKTETDCKNTVPQNSILIEDNYIVKEEKDFKEEIMTYLNHDNNNETYHSENDSVDNNKSNDITNYTLNVCVQLETERNDKYPSFLHENLFIKIEQMSPEGSDVFKENIFEIKTETNSKNIVPQNSILIEDNYIVKEEKDIKEEIITCQNDNDNELYIEKSNANSFKHSYGKQFKCDICEKSFSRKYILKNHTFTHTGVKPHKCNICQKSFSLRHILKNHMFTHTGVKPHKCNICQKSFTQKVHFTSHMFTHTGEKPYKCDNCQKSFARKTELQSHMFTHTGVRPHKCNICQKSFIQNVHITSHMFTHTGERPHKCNICQKSFTQKGQLSIHMSTHSGIKPHKCNICLKSFIQKGYLKKHMITHSGNPYKCNACQKSFARTGNLKNHMFTHTKVKRH